MNEVEKLLKSLEKDPREPLAIHEMPVDKQTAFLLFNHMFLRSDKFREFMCAMIHNYMSFGRFGLGPAFYQLMIEAMNAFVLQVVPKLKEQGADFQFKTVEVNNE